MKSPAEIKRTVPIILKAINETNDEQQVELYENLLTAMLGSPLLFFGAIINIVIRNFILHRTYAETLPISIVFFILAILLEVVTRIPIQTRLMTHLLSLLISAWFFFVFSYLYGDIGPAVVTVGFIQIMIAITRPNRIMLIYVMSGSLISVIYVWVLYPDMLFVMDNEYYIIQIVLFVINYFMSAVILMTNRNRQRKIGRLLHEALQQKDETMSLYEEIAATEEELRSQNEQLRNYNDTILKDEERLNYLAYFDPLTELPNRKMVMERLQILIRLNKNLNSFYVVFIDIDDFKQVNDTMGHQAGDELITEVSETLKASMHRDDLAGRIGGDEFALIIQRPLDEEDVFHYIDQIRKRISEIKTFGKREIKTSASFGVAVYPDDGEEEIELMKCADTAMYKAKELGKNGIQFFRKEMKEEILRKIQLEKQLVSALENEEFFLVFQPQFTMDGKKIRGFEALIRWKSPQGIVSPMDFIPQAEKTGLIIPIGKWVLLTACRLFKELCGQNHPDAVISVNISAVQLKDRYFIQSINDILTDTGMDASCLELEITESVLIDSVEDTVSLLKELKKQGIQISLDDFGTGYSSLNYLKRLPINTLKIDKSFVRDICAGAGSNQFLADVILLAHHLNLSVIAEGVETNEQLKFLKNNGCDYAQGYYLGMPMDWEELKELIENKVKI